MLKLGTYLGISVIITEDLGNGWFSAVFPDDEHRKPLSYKKSDGWNLHKSQVKLTHDLTLG